MSTDHRKPVVAFVMLALAAALVVGVQHAEAQGGRLLAAAAGAGVHVQGTVVSPTETISARGYDRLAELGPAFLSVREAVGYTDASTVAADAGRARDRQAGKSAPAAGQRPGGRDTSGDRDEVVGSGSATAGPATRPGTPSAGGTGTAGKSTAGRNPGGSSSSTAGKRDATAGPSGRTSARGRVGTARGKEVVATKPAEARKSRSAVKRSTSRKAAKRRSGAAHLSAATSRSSRRTRPSARSRTRLHARVVTAPRASAVRPSNRPHRGGPSKR